MSTPREKLHDKLVLDGRRSPILKKDEATRYRSACMRLSYLAQDRLDLAETAKHLAQRMSEPREFDFVPLKRAARYLVGKPKAALRYRRQKHVDKISVFVESDFAGDPVSRKSTTGLVPQIGNHTVSSRSTLQSLTVLSVGEAEIYAVVKGCKDGLFLRSMYQDLGIPVKIEIQCDSSTSNSLTDRMGAGQRAKHIDTRYFLDTRTSSGPSRTTPLGTERYRAMLDVSSEACHIAVRFFDPHDHLRFCLHPFKKRAHRCRSHHSLSPSVPFALSFSLSFSFSLSVLTSGTETGIVHDS